MYSMAFPPSDGDAAAFLDAGIVPVLLSFLILLLLPLL